MKSLYICSILLLALTLLGCGEQADIRPEAMDGKLILNIGNQYYHGRARFITTSSTIQMVFTDSTEAAMNMYLPNQSFNKPETNKVYEFDPNNSGSNIAIFYYLTESGNADPDQQYRISSGEIQLGEVNRAENFIDLNFNLVMENFDNPDNQISLEGEGQKIPWD